MNRFAAMEAFVRVFETGSFSAAARQLRLGQPTVSKTIAQLEDELGVRLLLRSTHGLTPTQAGQSFYEHAKRSLEEAEEAERAARGASATLSGRLRVGAAVTFARLHVIPHLRTFLEQHPALEIDIALDDRNIDLIEAGIDITLRLGALTDSTLTARKIAECRRLVLGTPEYFASVGEPAVPADLMSREAIIYDQRGGGAMWTFRRGSTEASITLNGRLRITAGEGVRAAVLGSMGLVVASEWMFAPEIANGSVKAVLTEWTLPPLELWAVFPTGRRTSAKARAFAAFIEERLASQNVHSSTE